MSVPVRPYPGQLHPDGYTPVAVDPNLRIGNIGLHEKLLRILYFRQINRVGFHRLYFADPAFRPYEFYSTGDDLLGDDFESLGRRPHANDNGNFFYDTLFEAHADLRRHGTVKLHAGREMHVLLDRERAFSGAAHETGAHGNVINVPLPPMTGGDQMRRAWRDMILPAVDDFAPELIIVSAGFDAHEADPLANLNWTTADFAWITEAICDVAEARCGGRLVSTLEGGYDLNALAASVAAHVAVLMERGA